MAEERNIASNEGSGTSLITGLSGAEGLDKEAEPGRNRRGKTKI